MFTFVRRLHRRASRVPAATTALGFTAAAFLTGVQPAASSRAQSAVSSDASNNRIIVTGQTVPDENNNVLASPSQGTSAYGNARDILDTPRSVDSITSQLIEDDQIRSIRDISRASSSTYAPNVFGLTSLPYIRGQEGEIFQNGIRRQGGNNGYGLPFSFNSVETIDVVKGPATPVYGPTQRVGGYINLVTKEPFFDALHGEVNGSLGSFDSKRYQIDIGGPIIKDELAYRVSFEQEDDGSYYRNAYFQSTDLYFDLGWKPNNKFRLDLNFEYLEVPHYPDIAGINRPTQALIDHDTYITGTGVSPITGTVPGPGAVISPTGTTEISHADVLADPQDYGNSTSYIAELIGTYKFNDNLALTNRVFYQDLAKQTVNENSFVEIIKTNRTFEDRLEMNIDYDVPIGSREVAGSSATTAGKDKESKDAKAVAQVVPLLDIKNKIITGLDFRYLHTLGFSQFLTEADNPGDLTGPLNLLHIPNSTVLSLVNAFPIPGYNKNILASSGGTYPGYVNPVTGVTGTANSDTNDTDIYQGGIFWQQNIAFTDWINIDLGGRGDLVNVTVRDPLPPPGFAAASDSIVYGQGAGNASLTLKPTSNVSIYGTFNFSQSSNSALGGGYTLDGTNQLPRSDFHIRSYLYEVGIKASLLHNTLYLATAGFDQTRSFRNRDGSTTALDVRGVEGEATYQPNKNFYATASISYLDAHTDDSALSQDTGRVEDAFDNSKPNIINGTGVGSPSFTVFGPGDLRFPDLPKILFNTTISYTFDFGLGASFNTQVTSDQNADVPGLLKIPAQYEMNAAVFFRRKNYEARLDVFNFTDQRNFSAPFEGGFFGATDIFPELPIRLQGTLRLKF